MPTKQIRDFQAVVTLAGTDDILIQQVADSVTRRVSPSQIDLFVRTPADAANDLGAASNRFRDLFLSRKVTFSDSAAAPSAVGILRRNGADLQYHDGTRLYSLLARENFNFTYNGDMEVWGAGVSAAPTGWALVGAGASVARNAASGKITLAAADLTRSGTNCYLEQIVNTKFPGPSVGAIDWWKGKTLTLGVWVKATVANRGFVVIGDGVGESLSAAHSGGGTYEFLTVTRTIDAAATLVAVRLYILTGDTTASFDGVILVQGSTVTDFIPSGWRGRTSARLSAPGIQAQAQTLYVVQFGSATETEASVRAPFNMVLRNLHLDAGGNVGGAGQTWTVTLRTGESTDTALTAQVASGARQAANTTNEVYIAKGALFSFKSVTSATTGNVAVKISVEVEEVP